MRRYARIAPLNNTPVGEMNSRARARAPATDVPDSSQADEMTKRHFRSRCIPSRGDERVSRPFEVRRLNEPPPLPSSFPPAPGSGCTGAFNVTQTGVSPLDRTRTRMEHDKWRVLKS